MSEKRYKQLQFAGEAMDSFLRGFHRHRIEKLPEDVSFVKGHYDDQRDMFVMTIQSEEFDAIPEGDEIPRTGFNIIQTVCNDCGQEMFVDRIEDTMFCAACDI